MFYQNWLSMRNTEDMTGGKPIAFWSQSISDVSVGVYDINGSKREVLFFYSVPDTTRDRDIIFSFIYPMVEAIVAQRSSHDT
jgi:hypothetical protein